MESIVEVIKEGEIIRMLESQAVEEDLFILRRIHQPEKEMAENISFIEKKEITNKLIRQFSPLNNWKSRRTEGKRNFVLGELKDNFHWDIVRARREKNFTRKRLGEEIEVPENVMRLIESGQLPTDDFVLISKIENFLGIRLRKEPGPEQVKISELQKQAIEKAQELRAQSERASRPPIEKKSEELSGSEIELIEDK